VSRALRAEDGVAMVEFALIASVLLILIFGIIVLGRYITYQSDETHLASEAARYAAVGQIPTACASTKLADCIRAQANHELLNGSSDVTPVSVCIANGGAGNIGDPVTVTVTSRYSFVPILRISSVTDTETATMRLEAAPTASQYTIIGCSP
jgi:Flp pilus assembly protein TadG